MISVICLQSRYKKKMNRQRILIVEDCESERNALRIALRSQYEVEVVGSGEEALDILSSRAFDLIILDLGLPKMDGYKLCANLRLNNETKDIAIIIFTGRFDIEDKLMAFSLGASDYITKPVDLRELRARVGVHLKAKEPQDSSKSTYFQVGPFEGDLTTQVISYVESEKKIEVPTSPLEFKLLHFFLTHIDHVVSRDQILDKVWGSGRHVNDRTVDVTISKLRQKLGPYSHFLQPVRGMGYRFHNPKEEHRRVA